MPDMRHFKVQEGEIDSRTSRWLAAAVMALGVGVLGAYSFASQEPVQPKSLPLTPSSVVRTTPDAPREVPPPVAPETSATK